MICHLKQRGRLYSLTYQTLQTTLFSSRSIHWINFLYSGLNLNQYGVASPCPDLNLIHYILTQIYLKK
ncbi:hypothetical protein BWZ27_09405 [Neisseria meningitidis]|nr:hypothetical protein [Neisseria meningitidis]OMH42970.1 hypothetical protein BWZ27_09405 [Neisseria meningitidis]OMH44753.1 hypothetical protein BWZ30_05090 [Neisseria meningitidis]OMH49207.1 hypothetical protein BWZ31_03565 [Neisseria meningitidis]